MLTTSYFKRACAICLAMCLRAQQIVLAGAEPDFHGADYASIGRCDYPARILQDDRFLIAHPESLHARLDRAAFEILCGDPKKAKLDIDAAKALAGPADQSEVQLYDLALAKATGSPKLEKDIREAMLHDHELSSPKGSLSMDQIDNHSRLLELDGNVNEAAALLNDSVKNDSAPAGLIRQSLAEFYLRHGDPRLAIENCDQAILDSPSRKLFPEANIRLDASYAHWIAGDLTAAGRQVTLVLRLCDSNRSELPFVSATEQYALAAAVVLNRLQPRCVETSAMAQSKESLSQRFPAYKRYYDCDLLWAVVLNRLTATQALAELNEIHKGEPALDWALWDDMYLGLLYPEEHRVFMDLVPANTVQRQILERVYKPN